MGVGCSAAVLCVAVLAALTAGNVVPVLPVFALAVVGVLAVVVVVLAVVVEPQPLTSTASKAGRHTARRGSLSMARAYSTPLF